jgi:PAS domain S-box-containing protein
MKPALRIVIIEDNPDDALLVVREVEHAGYAVQAQRVQTAEELRDALAQGTWDLVLADYSLPHFSATEGLAILKETGLDVPFIIVSGKIGEEMAVQLMKDGATDYVMKDRLARLGPAVQRELREADERCRKRDAERALAESEKRYRLLVESQTDLIVRTDPEGQLLYASPTYCALFGKTPQELMNSSYQPLIHPDDLPSVEHTVADLFHPPHSYHYEERAMTVGGWRWIEWTAHAELDTQGTVVAIVGSGRDITDRKQVEDQLHETSDYLNNLLDCANAPIIVWDSAYHISLFNHAFERLTGRSASNVLGREVDLLFPPDKREESLGNIRRASSGERWETVEIDIQHMDGTVRTLLWNSASLYAPDQTTVLATIAQGQDITDRKQMEEKLRMSEADLQQAQAVAHVGSWRWDIAHDEFVWSDEMCRIFGVAPHAFTGSVQDVIARAIHPDDRARIEESNRAIIEDHNPQPLEYRIVWPDGSVHTVWVKPGEMTLGDKGHVSSLTGVVLDITDRKRAEAERGAMQAQLLQSQKMEAIGQLAGGIAHDFNNLLTGMLGNMAIIRGDLPASDPLLANVLAAETAAHQAADLTKGLLAFSRRAMVSVVPLDMAEAVDTTLTILKQSLPASMTIIRDVEQPAWSVLADHSQISQVILNLAVNARDAMQGKGTLTIRLRNVQIGEDYIRTHPFARTGDFVHLSVADTGAGIPPEIRSHLFEPFHTTKPAGSGTGMGLSIVYGAIKQAGGWVTADSPSPEDVCSIRGAFPGVGTVFDIFLPRCLDEPSSPTAPIHLSANVCSGTILVVEDEPVVSAVTQALLTRSGCTVLTAGDGASALATFREHGNDVDLILLDMTMPGMTTDDIVRAIHDINAHVPVLLTSGYTSSDTVKRMLAEGTVQGFLPKPYELHELLSTINQLLQRT